MSCCFVCVCSVSILVLVDQSLGEAMTNRMYLRVPVSILVLVDQSLGGSNPEAWP